MDFLAWLESTALATAVAETLWAYPLLETLHAVGMVMLVGSLGLINLRVLGYKPALPIAGMQTLLRLAWIGFTLNAISGVGLFSSDVVQFFSSYTFRFKLGLLAFGGFDCAFVRVSIFPDSTTGLWWGLS